MKAYVDSMVALPKGGIDVAKVKKELTILYTRMGDTEALQVESYSEDSKYLYVPRAYGMKLISEYGFTSVDRMSDGFPARFPYNVVHEGKYEYQHGFVTSIQRAMEADNDFLIVAATGKGKTVCSLSAAQKRGRTTIVIVDQQNLMDQWVSEAQEKLRLRPHQVGIVQGKTCDFKGKVVVVAMIHSLVQNEYPPEFYDYFGTAIFDEAHTTGAPTFSQALSMFSARVRFGVSATMDRRDDLQKLIHLNLGDIGITLKDKHDTSYVYYIESDTVYSWYANISPKTGRILSEIAEDTDRNEKLAKAIQWLYDTGRPVLAISDRIEQLENVMAMCTMLGMPKEDLGLYCGFRNVWMFEKDPTPARRPPFLEKGCEYTPVRFTRVRKRITKKQLAEIKENSKVIFATYGMFTKGVDVPRLAGGVDLTPRSRAQQVHGRILRLVGGKLTPIWVTVRDTHSYRVEHQFAARIDEYIQSSAEIYKWKPEKGVRLMDAKDLRAQVYKRVKKLKQMNVITSDDGRNTLMTPDTPSTSGSRR